MKRKLTVVVLIIVFLASMAFALTACGGAAPTEASYDYLSFTETNGGLTVKVKSVGLMPAALTIPAQYFADGSDRSSMKDVTSIAADGFKDCSKLTSVTLPNNKMTIGEGAFAGCSAMATINLDNVQQIGTGAFKNCDKLTSLNFSGDLKKLNESVFSGCFSLASVSGGSITEIGDNAFKSCVALRNIPDLSAVTTIGEKAFFFTGCINSLTVPASCKYVGGSAFTGWSQYQTIKYYNDSTFSPDWKTDCGAVIEKL